MDGTERLGEVARGEARVESATVRPGRARRRRRRAVLRTIGSTLALAGLVVTAVVVYQLWGTGLSTGRAQAGFRTTIARDGYPTRPAEGQAIGFLQIPRIRVDVAFVEGNSDDELARGPGHYPATALPGEGGNVTLAGHRTTHAAPFWSLDALVPGDNILIQTAAGEFVYRVVWTRFVQPDAWWVTEPTADPSLTLTTCNPRFRGTERLVVRASQIYGQTPAGFIDHRGAGLAVGGELFASVES